MNTIITFPSPTKSSLTQRKSPSVVHLSAAKDLVAPPPQITTHSQRLSAAPLGLSRSYSARPLGRTVLVKAEFVYGDPGAKHSVSVHGDWNDWAGVPLNREETDLWSCVAMIPTGHREFYFVVDDSCALSTRHPVSVCGTKNWRNVLGPRASEQKTGTRTAFYKWAQGILEGLGLVVAPGDVGNSLTGPFGEIEHPCTARRRDGHWDNVRELGWGTLVVAAFSVYLVGVAVLVMVMDE